jgi:hypothetical protein
MHLRRPLTGTAKVLSAPRKNRALFLSGLLLILFSSCFIVATLPVFGAASFTGQEPGYEPRFGREQEGRTRYEVHSSSHAFKQEVDPQSNTWRPPKWQRDERSFLGQLGILPPYTRYQALAGVFILAGLVLAMQPWRSEK